MQTKRNISKFIFIIFCFVFAIGCAPKKQSVRSEEPQQKEQTQKNNLNQNLLDLPIDSKIIPLENPKHGTIKGSQLIVDVETIQEDSIYQVVADIPNEIDSLNSQAFRVQVFSTKKYGEARVAKATAEEIFDRPVFLDYEVPYYKIRVGNFSNRDKAEDYQQRVKSSGYKNAWVVVVIIDIKETSQLYDEIILPIKIDSLDNTQTEDESENGE